MSQSTELLARIDQLRSGLYADLRARPRESLATRPTPEEWSIVENVRHLLYAEQLHLARSYLDDFAYSPIGMANNGRPRRSGVGTDPTTDLEQVLTAWDAVHEAVRGALDGAEDTERALGRNLAHLRTHVRTIGKLLARDAAG
ncbi:MAG: DinB family protein [Chloroflexi bacterium]|nr:DinB family protein [Chloroflexota bacterium]MDA1146631.1 DinB family protein [Chloroflexota bacterium]MQC82825.1 DinB family protein [Chloroflexota bacterium]